MFHCSATNGDDDPGNTRSAECNSNTNSITSTSSTNPSSAKIEMCQHILLGKPCPFGNTCTYAHHPNDLRLQTLIERERAGLIDAKRFRTRPCLDHVMTGSCPFHFRCSEIHDERITNINSPSWLPRCLQLNSLPTDVHVDYNRILRNSCIHYGSAFGRESDEMFSSYQRFVNIICQKLPNNLISPLMGHGVHMPPLEPILPNFAQRLQIALAMTSPECPSMIKYRPTHFILRKLCMIRQVRAFDLSPSSPSSIVEIPLSHVEEADIRYRNPYHLIVREVFFGLNLDEDVPPPALWFNLPASEIKECTHKDELKHNRRKKKKKRLGIGGQQRSNAMPATICIPAGLSHYRRANEHCFRLYYPNDKDLYSLIRKAMYVELEKVMSHMPTAKKLEVKDFLMHSTYKMQDDSLPRFGDSCIKASTENITAQTKCELESAWLENCEFEVRHNFYAMQRLFAKFRWPVTEGREPINDRTLVPPAEGHYSVTLNDRFHSKLWKSFVSNIHDNSSPYSIIDEGVQMERGIGTYDISCGEKQAEDNITNSNSTQGQITMTKPIPYKSGRLRVFEKITEKQNIRQKDLGSPLPNICFCPNSYEKGSDIKNGDISKSKALLFEENFWKKWKVVQEYYCASKYEATDKYDRPK